MKVCPSCESLNFELVRGGVYLKTSYKCLDCNSTFAAPVEVSEEMEPEAQETALEQEEPAPVPDPEEEDGDEDKEDDGGLGPLDL